MINNKGTQTFLAQTIVQKFVENKDPTFNSFIIVWKELNGTKIHGLLHLKPLIFGRVQPGIQTFLGFCSPNKKEIEKLAGLFGIYIVHETQGLQYSEPILVTYMQFEWLKDIVKINEEAKSIFSFLLKNKCFCFSAVPYLIHTRYTLNPPEMVADNKQYRILTNEEMRLKRKVENFTKPNEEKDLNEEYNYLLAELGILPHEAAD